MAYWGWQTPGPLTVKNKIYVQSIAGNMLLSSLARPSVTHIFFPVNLIKDFI